MYSDLTNRLTLGFMPQFCNADGSINWEKLVKYNSQFIPNENKYSVFVIESRQRIHCHSRHHDFQKQRIAGRKETIFHGKKIANLQKVINIWKSLKTG